MSITGKLLSALLIGALLVGAAAGWGAYQLLLEGLKRDLVEQGNLLAIAVNEAVQSNPNSDAIRVAVEDITEASPTLKGITVATKTPFTIWASSIRSNDPLDPSSLHMLTQLSASAKNGLFGHFFNEQDGDLILLRPLWIKSASGSGNRMQLKGNFHRPGAKVPAALPLIQESVLQVPEETHQGVIYVRFDWNTVMERSNGLFWRAAQIALIGLLIMIAAVWILMSRIILQPLTHLSQAIGEQSRGQTGSRVPDLGNDEFGQLGKRFNSMLKALETRDRRLRNIVDNLPIALSLRDQQGGELITNQQHRDWSLEISRPLEELDTTSIQLIQNGEILLWDHDSDDIDGRHRHFTTVAFPTGDSSTADAGEWAAASIDITARKELELDLISARDTAEEASVAKTRFLSSMSHELRTPLNALIGFTELLRLGVDEKEQDHFLELMDKAGRHLLHLVNEVLDLSHVESGSLRISIEDVNVGLVMEECAALTRPLADERSIKMNFRQPEPPIFVRADHTRLKQSLLNLVSNAIKYNCEGGLVAVTTLPAEHRPSMPPGIRIEVVDTGAGIPYAMQKRLFQPFERLDAGQTTIEGTGIGLVLTRRLIEMMDGRVGFESEEGQGSRFWLELPLCKDQHLTYPDADKPNAATQETESVDLKAHTLLYVEDNLSNMKLVESIISQHTQLELLSAPHPRLGLELARAHKPDLILLDINLPDLDGYQVLQQLRASPETSKIPVIAISANAMQSDIERGIDAGFQAYLPKPIHIQELLDTIRDQLPGAL